MFLHDSGQTSVVEFNDSIVYGQNRHQDHTGIFKVTQESCVLTLSTGGRYPARCPFDASWSHMKTLLLREWWRHQFLLFGVISGMKTCPRRWEWAGHPSKRKGLSLRVVYNAKFSRKSTSTHHWGHLTHYSQENNMPRTNSPWY